MCEPTELTHLRETLSRRDAVEAFRHVRGHQPVNDAQLEAFIEDFVRDAYADGVENWTDVQRVEPVYRRSRDAPLGRKLRAAGFDSLWGYFDQRGFTGLDQLKTDLEFDTLAPTGFESFVREVAQEDGNWENAVRALATQALNNVRNKPGRDFIAFMGIHRIASNSPSELRWIKAACNQIVDVVQKNDTVLRSAVSWTDTWLVDIVHQNATQPDSDRS